MGEERGKKDEREEGEREGGEERAGEEKRGKKQTRRDWRVTGLTENAPPCTCSLTLRKSLT